MIVILELSTEMVHVLCAENDKMVEAFLLNGLDEPFDEGVGVG